jgi:hypothetical protein
MRYPTLVHNLLKCSIDPILIENINNNGEYSSCWTDFLDLLLRLGQRLGRSPKKSDRPCFGMGKCNRESLSKWLDKASKMMRVPCPHTAQSTGCTGDNNHLPSLGEISPRGLYSWIDIAIGILCKGHCLNVKVWVGHSSLSVGFSFSKWSWWVGIEV